MMAENEILYFTKKERTGILLMMAIVLILQVSTFFYERFFEKQEKIKPEVLQRFAELVASEDQPDNQFTSKYQEEKNDQPAKEISLFPFDPNRISLQEWKQLGVKDKTAQTILKYLSKGGKFRTADDLKKVWGLQHDAERLMPFVRIANEEKTFSHNVSAPADRQPKKIDINTADSLAWLSLPGIGPALTKRILAFKNGLGGFYAVQQVKETFGLADSTFQKIKPRLELNKPMLRKIDINEADIDQLKKHPYIRYQLANVIIQYRNQHGKFNAVEDLRKIMILPDSVYVKMSPYLSVN